MYALPDFFTDMNGQNEYIEAQAENGTPIKPISKVDSKVQ